MRGFNLIGVLLLLAGIALAATTGFSFEERQYLMNEQNADVSYKEQYTRNWPWLAGTIAVIGGVAIFLIKANKRS
ncbi:MAG TPA: hypothetical protein VD794_02610 [Flavisolibacter sp.]|nr:hypothetical protein [Flavisolibacter sp.]